MKVSFNSVARLADSDIANDCVRILVFAVQHCHQRQRLAYVRLLINNCIEKTSPNVFYVLIPTNYIP